MQTRERIRAQHQRYHGEALDAFIARKHEIDAMLQRLTTLGVDHFRVEPDHIDWGRVGTVGHHAYLPRQISDSAFQEHEHAR